MTWGEFKKAIEEKGVANADVIQWIDCGGDAEFLDVEIKPTEIDGAWVRGVTIS
jgi:hypothetical protein